MSQMLAATRGPMPGIDDHRCSGFTYWPHIYNMIHSLGLGYLLR